MEPNYSPLYPNGDIEASIKDFISNFYQVSDDPAKNDDWVRFFAEDATVIMGKKAGRGRDEIAQLRRGMWETVANRRHRLDKVFPAAFGSDGAPEYMLFGTAAYELKTGESKMADWAGYARLQKDADGQWTMRFYRVYLEL